VKQNIFFSGTVVGTYFAVINHCILKHI